MGMHRALCTICPQVVATERRGLIYVVTPVCQFHRIHGQLAAIPWLGIAEFFSFISLGSFIISFISFDCFCRPAFLFKGASVLADACAAGDASSEGEFCRTEFGVRGPWFAGPGLRLLFWYIEDQRTGEHERNGPEILSPAQPCYLELSSPHLLVFFISCSQYCNR